VFIDAQRVARLASMYADGTPHVVTICPVLDADRVVIATDLSSQKASNIRGDPHVAVVFDEYSEDWGDLRQIVVFGRALLIESGPEFQRDRSLLYEKFEQYEGTAPIEEGTAVIIEIHIDRVSASGVR
jgi:nitroimidazol reductase NimA-like FMN-containing flavoprotein (pyridoxamine 5'-phosphate oxidase superfamily)